MKLQYTFLFVLIAALTSCTSSSIQEEEALFENDNTSVESVEVNASSIETEVLDVVNTHREEMGLTKLQLSTEAYKYADEHTNYMISKGKISHDNFNERANKLANETGATVVKENVAKNYPKAEQAMNGWLNSRSHRNTIEGDFTHTTISVKADEKGKLYYTQLFFKK
ncbi:CAP domain-containing protein [uncultured Croceitalea sp.]|uniref:CAP domain-containing protein n=1 Tax=uncultured Croceitalea sp. TaxID=1798908 RepID=UPI00374F6ED8